MYEEPYLHIILLFDNDVVRTSNIDFDNEWSDENVDDGGWT
jgi:hypothetical protein